MKNLSLFSLLGSIVLLSLLVGCGRVRVDESLTADEQWAIAKSDFEHENYLDAIDVLNIFTLNYSGSSLIDSAQFLLGECHFALGEYILAESEYLRLAQNFLQSPLVESARLKMVLCNLYLSPSYSHDQKYTEKAVAVAQDFLQDYPNSEIPLRLAPRASTWQMFRQIFTLGAWRSAHGDVADGSLFSTKVVYPRRSRSFGNWLLNVLTLSIYPSPEPQLSIPPSKEFKSNWIVKHALMDSQTRLAQKNYKSAELYYRQGKYPSAVIYCDRVLDLYGQTVWAGPALRLKGNSLYAMRKYAEAALAYEKYLKDNSAEDRREVQSKWEASLRHLQQSSAVIPEKSEN